MKKKEKWYVAAKKADFTAIAAKFGIDQVTARLIRNRGVIGMEAVQEYLHGTLSSLHAPGQMKGANAAADLLAQKIREKKKIRIIGDYDIDGVCSTYILYRALSSCGGRVDYEIPDRMRDGYGLNIHLVELAFQEQVDTIITCDNGIAAIAEIAYAKEKGMTVIVTDHHEPLFVDEVSDTKGAFDVNTDCRTYRLPPADVVVNPHQPGCPYPYKKLCGAAVAWKVVCILLERMGHDQRESDELLAFAGFATVGDVMDLDGENRILVKEGLTRLHHTTNQGLCALIRANNLEKSEVTAYHIGFVLGPCINASGRLDTAKRSLRLLLSDTREEADELAAQLKELNDERKFLTQKASEEAFAMIDGSEEYRKDRVLVVYLPDCHESIAGIVAGRLREHYYKPVFVITDTQEYKIAKGSGRSIEAYSMFEEMVKCEDLFLKFGGHPMAAGFSLEKERIPEMRRRLNAGCTLTEDELTEKISIDVPMPIDYISERVIRELSLLEPFGKGNEKPVFAERSLRILSARIVGKNRNVVKMKVLNQAGCTMDALLFGDPEPFQSYLTEKYSAGEVRNLFWGRDTRITIDVTYYPSVNEYMGRRTLEIVIKNYR
ncbi:MAG: DHHA1 domain-containing protein [Lachnospiraceae bacterium]|nr:DHHA1 domain-containing protein [Lachnospiraceae bacterium]